jgi:hypothetical protein
LKYYIIIALVTILLLSENSMAISGNSGVTFMNNSEKLLRCDLKTGNEYTPFIRLQPGSSKHFENFKIGSQVRCYTDIDKTGHSSTPLTYFSVNTEGVYELLQERVACETCPAKFRFATIVTFPNGEAFYNKYH